ncbi:unnamed protein product [Arctia plantaginis]|uniref:MD-2-related lipid-recognition domain-containing protein n=1 Tax=Arctia plantaginis TaxID=874455 RepID=A0A8S1AKH0_ARCPL|nr:unnamed protein product [Arctia plantaginis]
MYLVCVLLQAIFVAVSASVLFQDCGSAYDLRTVNIEGCTMRPPCYVTVGEDVKVNLQFSAGGYFMSRNLDQNVVIDINHLYLPTNVTPERCEIENCPVEMGAFTSFTSIMSVPTRVQLNQRGFLRWRIRNEEGRLVLCYTVLVQTQSPLQKLIRRNLLNLTGPNAELKQSNFTTDVFI